MRYMLLLLLPLAALLLSVGYSRFAERRLSEYRALLSLLSYLKGRMSTRLETVPEMLSGFSEPALMRSGLFDGVARGEGIYRSFLHARGRLSLSEEVKRIIEPFFRGLGTGYLESELRAIDCTREELSAQIALEEAELTKTVGLYRALLFLFAAGLVILLI